MTIDWETFVGNEVRLANGNLLYVDNEACLFGFGGMEHAILLRRDDALLPPFEWRDGWAYQDDFFPHVFIQAFCLRDEMRIDASRLEYLIDGQWKSFEDLMTGGTP